MLKCCDVVVAMRWIPVKEAKPRPPSDSAALSSVVIEVGCRSCEDPLLKKGADSVATPLFCDLHVETVEKVRLFMVDRKP